ncbi:hypothetical protein [Fulvivirga lutea]|uniref:Uncharacterized protein n=1 Tax=Fulvivirga lutea TaxID=2810512 RepID=A0A974WHI0_9BACT|nr:hypothetical protein [Fulvivirga lutea]QSE97232.1 hypothetical protein JR347_16820 [Fulvivirga lutea]
MKKSIQILLVLFCSSASAQNYIEGFVHTSNLGDYHKKKANLISSDYLLLTTDNNYLLEYPKDLELLIGKYCKIYGHEIVTDQWLFACKVFSVDSIVKIEYKYQNLNNEAAIVSIKNYHKATYDKIQLDTLSGKIIRYHRSSPDISGDYAVKIDTPIPFQSEGDDEPLQLYKIPLNHLDHDMLFNLESKFVSKQQVTLIGYLYSGYGHMLYMQVIEIY